MSVTTIVGLDHFTDANNVPFLSHVPDNGGNWLRLAAPGYVQDPTSNNFQIQTDLLGYCPPFVDGHGWFYGLNIPDFQDGYIQCKAASPNVAFFLVGRFNTSNYNTMFKIFNNFGNWVFSSYSHVINGPVPAPSDILKIQLIGTVGSFYVNNILIGSVTEITYPPAAGKWGFLYLPIPM